MHMTLRQWGIGGLGAAINAGIGGITLMIVDPNDFNPFAGAAIYDLAKVMVALALVGFSLYVKDHPIPLSADPKE